MAVMQSRDTRTFEAGGDLSAGQFKFVTLAADGQVDITASAGGNAIGVLLTVKLTSQLLLVVMPLASS